MNKNLVTIRDNVLVTSSRQVAEKFNKQHTHVLRSINILVEKDLSNFGEMFARTTFEDCGRTYTEYFMNKDGFTLLVMGFTGDTALAFKLEYIKAFNDMQKQLRDLSTPKTYIEALRELIISEEEKERLRLDNEAKQVLLEIQKPKADYFDKLVDRNLLTSFRDTAKELKIGQAFLIQWLLDNKYVYRDIKGILHPYMPYVPELFNIKEWTTPFASGIQTLITPRGRETFKILYKESTT